MNFSIGPYQDRVLCDMVPMTCAHLILGRPWQYSRRTIHDGFDNIYMVHKDGQRYKLNPLPLGVLKEYPIIFFGEHL